jgi:hypothetical protein
MATATQRVTATDLANGRIRIAVGQKELFPSTRTRIDLRLRGPLLESVSWDPRFGPDRERSGVLGVGRVVRELVQADEHLNVAISDGMIEIV